MSVHREQPTTATYDGRAFTTWAPPGATYRPRKLTPFVPVEAVQARERRQTDEPATEPHQKVPRLAPSPPPPPRQILDRRQILNQPKKKARKRYRSSPAVEIDEVRKARSTQKPPKAPKKPDPLQVLNSLGVSLRLPDERKPIRPISRTPIWAAGIVCLVAVLAVALYFLGSRLVGPELQAAVAPGTVVQPKTPEPAPKTASLDPESVEIPIRIKAEPTRPPSRDRSRLHPGLFAGQPSRVVLKRRKRPRRRPRKRRRRRARARAHVRAPSSSVDAEVDALLSSGSRSRSRSGDVDVDALLSAGTDG